MPWLPCNHWIFGRSLGFVHPVMGSGGIEKSHSCKWAKWIQWHALPHIQQSTQQRNKGYYPNLHGWDFSIPPLPSYGQSVIARFCYPSMPTRGVSETGLKRQNKTNTHNLHLWSIINVTQFNLNLAYGIQTGPQSDALWERKVPKCGLFLPTMH